MIKKYNPLPLLIYAHHITPDWSVNNKILSYLNIRLLSLGHCVDCGNTRKVDRVRCDAPTMSVCCGGCVVSVECDNCK
jgi:hypothetical protein